MGLRIKLSNDMEISFSYMLLFLFTNHLNAGSVGTYTNSFNAKVNVLYSNQIDINGDNVTDSIKVIRTDGKMKEFKGKYVLKNVWNNEAMFQQDTQLVFVFLISRIEKKSFLPYIVYNRSFFSTPIWHTTKLPVSIARGDRGKALVNNNCEKHPTGDVVELGTEAGIDMYLYWDNEEMKVCEPDEEP